jgi:pimeloyl-ACP methyl ester carboxylesterase
VQEVPRRPYAQEKTRLSLRAHVLETRPSRPGSRGSGWSERTQGADRFSPHPDTGTLAGDMAALMTALGHRRFAMVGHDVGMWTGWALAADHPDPS